MFKLPELPYDYGDLEPYIDEETMRIHHDKHHGAYVENLNKALENLPEYQNKSIEEIMANVGQLPENSRQAVINNGGGHLNHTFFWNIMTPKKTKPDNDLNKILTDKFGGVNQFKEAFTQKAMSVFGSGWAFLILKKEGGVELKRHSFQNSPVMFGNIPLLAIDVWEHAYYLKYRNKRIDYVNAWWNTVNWERVSINLQQARTKK